MGISATTLCKYEEVRLFCVNALRRLKLLQEDKHLVPADLLIHQLATLWLVLRSPIAGATRPGASLAQRYIGYGS